MSRSIVQNVDQLRSLPIGTTLSMPVTDLVPSAYSCIVKVSSTIYATPSDDYPGASWSYYSEDEVTGTLQGDPDAAWFPLNVEEIPSA